MILSNSNGLCGHDLDYSRPDAAVEHGEQRRPLCSVARSNGSRNCRVRGHILRMSRTDRGELEERHRKIALDTRWRTILGS